MHSYPVGTTFFRARSIPPDDKNLPLRMMRSVSDAWEPPISSVKTQGRLNKINQQVLYCCANDWSLAIQEARASSFKNVAMMRYKSIRPTSVSVIGGDAASEAILDVGSRRFYSFLEEEFSKIVDAGNEARYSISRAIAETFYTLPEQDAWCYRSVQSPSKANVAFMPGRASLCLKLEGVMICATPPEHAEALMVKYVVDFDAATGAARYHSIGSDGQKEIFPEF